MKINSAAYNEIKATLDFIVESYKLIGKPHTVTMDDYCAIVRWINFHGEMKVTIQRDGYHVECWNPDLKQYILISWNDRKVSA